MNVLAIDYGEKRVGIAIGDTETGIAFPRDIIGPKDAFSYISSLCGNSSLPTKIP
jgi:RNase H-fold protein (predicted Holliday junction resolvase)